MSDRITLRAVTARARHGVLPEEKITPQPFIVDLDLEADLSGAGASDRLADTVNYATIAAQAHRTLTRAHPIRVPLREKQSEDRVKRGKLPKFSFYY